jgi:hypothetical protein
VDRAIEVIEEFQLPHLNLLEEIKKFFKLEKPLNPGT